MPLYINQPNPIAKKRPINTCQPKYLSIEIPAKVTNETIKPAIKTPKVINGNAFLKGILNKKAIIEPVHAPVIGNGMATKAIKAILPLFSIFEL